MTYVQHNRDRSGRRITVVRHDRIEGGTKRFPLSSYIEPGRSYAYASPAYGYAQLAIAVACREAGATFHLFTAKRKFYSAVTVKAVEAGANLHPVDPGYLSHVQHRSRLYTSGFAAKGIELLPFGLSTDWMVQGVADYARSLPVDPPSEVWVAAGSGTLWRGLHQAWPEAFFNVVRVGKDVDASWTWGAKVSYRLWSAPEPFDRPAKDPPPFPSAVNYDAKVWQFYKVHGTDRALFWNTAG